MIHLTQKRRASDQVSTATAAIRIYVGAALFLCTLTVIAVVALAIYAPKGDTTSNTVVGITGAITLMLVVAGINAMAKAVNGRVTQLLDTKAEAERAKGVIEGLQQNPVINLDKPTEPDRS